MLIGMAVPQLGRMTRRELGLGIGVKEDGVVADGDEPPMPRHVIRIVDPVDRAQHRHPIDQSIDRQCVVENPVQRRQRLEDQWDGFRKGLRQRKLDHFADHAIAAYVDRLAEATGGAGDAS